MQIALITFVVLAAFFVLRRPSGRSGPPASAQLESYLLAMDRRHRQLRKERLSDW